MINESKNQEYLAKIFKLIRQRDEIVFADGKTHFNKTELRLLSEVAAAKAEGKHLISTQIAKRLGITRSAVSQIVNRLEEQGVVKRVGDKSDKKIAYVELSTEILDEYATDIQNCKQFVGRLVEEFGEENFEQMCALTEQFVALVKSKVKNKPIIGE